MVVHLKTQSEDGRLFGGNGDNSTLIPGELAHALHFSCLSESKRDSIQSEFGHFFSGELSVGEDFTHSLKKETNPTVAFLEALDHFSGRLAVFVRHTPGRKLDDQFYLDFIRDEIVLGRDVARPANDQPSLTDVRRDRIEPASSALKTSSVEGAVYGAIYLDWARRPGIGLKGAVGAVLRSKKLTFGQFKSWVESNEQAWFAALKEVSDAWGM